MPAHAAAALTRAAAIADACRRGLGAPAGAADAATLASREAILRRLLRQADRALADATNVAAATLAGWAVPR